MEILLLFWILNHCTTLKYGCSFVTARSCMSAVGVENLHFIEGRMDKWKFWDLFEKNFSDSVGKWVTWLHLYFIKIIIQNILLILLETLYYNWFKMLQPFPYQITPYIPRTSVSCPELYPNVQRLFWTFLRCP